MQKDNLCLSAFFANWQEALHFPLTFLFAVWSAGCRSLLFVKQAPVRCGDRYANPAANRKQARVISLNKKLVPYGMNLKTTPTCFLGLDLNNISIRARYIL